MTTLNGLNFVAKFSFYCSCIIYGDYHSIVSQSVVCSDNYKYSLKQIQNSTLNIGNF